MFKTEWTKAKERHDAELVKEIIKDVSGDTPNQRTKGLKKHLKPRGPQPQITTLLNSKGTSVSHTEAFQEFYQDIMTLHTSSPPTNNETRIHRVCDELQQSETWNDISHPPKHIDKAIRRTNAAGAPGYDGVIHPMIMSIQGITDSILCNVWSHDEHVPHNFKTCIISYSASTTTHTLRYVMADMPHTALKP